MEQSQQQQWNNDGEYNHEYDPHAKWEITKITPWDNDVIKFQAQNIHTKKKVALEAFRAGWEWGVGDLLDLSEYGYMA